MGILCQILTYAFLYNVPSGSRSFNNNNTHLHYLFDNIVVDLHNQSGDLYIFKTSVEALKLLEQFVEGFASAKDNLSEKLFQLWMKLDFYGVQLLGDCSAGFCWCGCLYYVK